ncbi:hypothetical protein Syun_029083 [Stephania yunnanensis]|uniref:Xylanase inhibitor N-terminal domain-containing protein n=1 Tax=Stephania yunnanensis TaxID=152371 RepID=A0AAP0E4X7_9MAGN
MRAPLICILPGVGLASLSSPDARFEGWDLIDLLRGRVGAPQLWLTGQPGVFGLWFSNNGPNPLVFFLTKEGGPALTELGTLPGHGWPALVEGPKALLLQVTKDPSTLQYLTRFTQRTHPKLINVVVNLGGRYLWVECDKGYVSSSYRPVLYRSASCALAENNDIYCSCIHGHERKEVFEGLIMFIGYMCGKMNTVVLCD